MKVNLHHSCRFVQLEERALDEAEMPAAEFEAK
jgi:hypothetical protein